MTEAISKSKGIYFQLYNIHGLIRGSELELGRDADTGGQTKYVLELAKALSQRQEVSEVEIITRYINDKEVSADYSQREEVINDKLKIIRIRCGGSKYIRKEKLWGHLEEFVDKSIKYIKAKGYLPDIIHSHYADAGYICTKLSKFFGIPFIHTGHSLGKNKLNNLLAQGIKKEEIEKRYKMDHRIEVEEEAIFCADRIITSTYQEIDKQYGLYKNSSKEKFVVIPPSVDLERFHPFNFTREWDDESQVVRTHIRDEFYKFFTNMYKPIILSLCRPEKRKNISGLIQAYGENKELQEKANLAIFAGIRKDIQQMPDIEREVLTEILLLLDKYNLYGKMAVPKRHDFEHEVPELYRIAAESRGVFVNSAYNEPFGLTLIEAAASGLPVVTTDDGGPRDILSNLDNGILVDVTDSRNIADAINAILNDEQSWMRFSNNGIDRINKFYSWDAHTESYLDTIKNLLGERKENPKTFISAGPKLLKYKRLMIFDIDDTLLGNRESEEIFNKFLLSRNDDIGYGVATGRTIESAIDVLKKHNFLLPDFIISSVGSEIYYGSSEDDYVFSTGWKAHISHKWNRNRIVEILNDVDYLEYQESETQRDHKVSYYIKEGFDADELRDLLNKSKIRANLIISHKQYLDILPLRASKGRAIRYLSYRWNIPHESILVAGDSGNDEDMLTGELLGIVVGNHSDELEKLRGRRRIYFARENFATGIMEGIKYYNFKEGV